MFIGGEWYGKFDISLRMEGDFWVLLLSFFPKEDENKLKSDIISALKPYSTLSPEDIYLTHREDRYSARIKVPAEKGKIIEALKQLKIGSSVIGIRRYYYDHQLYISRIPPEITSDVLEKYFSNFGKVDNIVLTSSVKTDNKNQFCFIKFSDLNAVNKVLLVRKLEIRGKEIRACRTYRIGQSEATNSKLSVAIEYMPQSIQAFENQQYFQTLGELRERTKLEVQRTQLYGILIFTSKQHSDNVLAKFDANVLSKGEFKIKVQPYRNDTEDVGKIFVRGLSKLFDEPDFRKVFEAYGEILEMTFTPTTYNAINAIITYAKEQSAKRLIAEYYYDNNLKQLFVAKPKIDFFLSPNERKSYDAFVKKGSTNKGKEPPPLPFPMIPGSFFPNPYQPRFPMQQQPPFRDPRFDSFQRQ